MKDIAFKDNTVAEEEKLPFSVVLYPEFYGAFFGFKKDKNDSQIFFCSCAKEAIKNYIVLEVKRDVIGCYDNGKEKFFLDYGQFPKQFIESIRDESKNKNIIDTFCFENKICHECNKIIPSYRYCHEMYGGAFKQNYGWYIQKQGYEWGFSLSNINFNLCPQEILDLLKIEPQEYFKLRQKLVDDEWQKAYELEKEYGKQQRKVWNVIENEVREKFGHKKIGEAWTSETILYYIVETLFPEYTVLRHYRPDFLEGLELDIFIKELNIGIEYQGIQHYKPVRHWGGKEALKKVQERDKKKKQICKKLSVNLIYFEHNEELSNDFVFNRINENTK